MALRSVIYSKLPMVIILGATGTGKTKLSVELAQKFGTEIISADSMQIYKGLDVVTAKASMQERELVRHHLLDILEPHQMFTVVDFRNRTLKIMDELKQQGKMPIIVGGTNYYIESIVYQILVEDMDDSSSLLWEKSRRKRDYDDEVDNDEPDRKKHTERVEESDSSKSEIETDDLKYVDRNKLKHDIDNEKHFTNAEIHEKLKTIDPEMASQLHPNNRRKVLRSIEVWLKSGRKHSEVLAEQKQTEGKLRRPGDTIILWLKCEQTVHNERLDARVDNMLKEGLIKELLDFHDRHNKHRVKDGKPPDYTKGIFQTLGFKEFHNYLMMSEDQRSTDEGQQLLRQSIDNMKLATKRYARRQNKMVRARFLEHPDREVSPIWELDTTELSKWDEEVKNKAITIIESFLENKTCPCDPLQPMLLKGNKLFNKSSNYCNICERLIIGDKEYGIHLQSNRHMKVLKKKKTMEILENKVQLQEK